MVTVMGMELGMGIVDGDFRWACEMEMTVMGMVIV